jgi:hypothetical protein
MYSISLHWLPVEDTMLESRHCADFLIAAFSQLWSFLMSKEGDFLFASLATGRAIFHYLRRSSVQEARELAAGLVVAMIFAVLVTVAESKVSRDILHATKCKSFDHAKSVLNISDRNR